MAVKVIHLLGLLLAGYTLVTLEVYFVLDAAAANDGSSGRSSASQAAAAAPRAINEAAQVSAAAASSANDLGASSRVAANARTDVADTKQRPHGNLKGTKEQDLAKKFNNIHAVQPVTPAIVEPPSRLHVQDASASVNAAPDIHTSMRFPQYGTQEFTRLCPYMSALPKPVHPNCTLVLHPQPGSNEGLAAWVSMIVQGHLLTRQNGCGLKFDYGPNIDVSSLIVPYRTLDSSTAWEDQVSNWLIPPNYDCGKLSHCYVHSTATVRITGLGNAFRRYTYEAPNYRYAYVGLNSRFNATLYEPIKTKLVGFDVKLGAACSLGLLFHPSPDIVKYEPTFYSNLLPTLREERTLVLAVYIRSGFADVATAAENRGENATDSIVKGHARGHMEDSVACAVALEEDMISQDTGGKYGRVVWMVVSDSPTVKDHLADEYGGKHLQAPTRSIPRQILHTTAKGMHTRPKRGPSTADFAAGFLDWYLLAESDVVVTTGGIYSFGAVAAIRTARPLYSAISAGAKENRIKKGLQCQGVSCHCVKTYDASDEMARLMVAGASK